MVLNLISKDNRLSANVAQKAGGHTEFRTATLEAVDESLLGLGESTRRAIYFHIEKRYGVKREEIPERLEEFSKALEGLFHEGGRVLERLIARNLCIKFSLDFDEQTGLTLADYADRAAKLRTTA